MNVVSMKKRQNEERKEVRKEERAQEGKQRKKGLNEEVGAIE